MIIGSDYEVGVILSQQIFAKYQVHVVHAFWMELKRGIVPIKWRYAGKIGP